MKQLVQLQKSAEQFKKLNTEMIFVFREENGGVNALKEMKSRYKTKYTLTIDPKKKSTAKYSSGRMVFDNYVISKDGKIAGIVDGTLRDRATTEELTKLLGKISM